MKSLISSHSPLIWQYTFDHLTSHLTCTTLKSLKFPSNRNGETGLRHTWQISQSSSKRCQPRGVFRSSPHCSNSACIFSQCASNRSSSDHWTLGPSNMFCRDKEFSQDKGGQQQESVEMLNVSQEVTNLKHRSPYVIPRIKVQDGWCIFPIIFREGAS